MILILTQCFPSRIGGIESLISNLAFGLSQNEKVIVLADSYNITQDSNYDNKFKKNFLVKRTRGIKFFRRYKKIREMKSLIASNKIKLVIGESWKSLELGIDFLNLKTIPVICLVHGNELLSKNIKKLRKIKKIYEQTTTIVANSIYIKNLIKETISPNIKINLIYPGAEDLRRSDGSEISALNGSPIILTLARLEKRKGHLYVIQSVKKLLFDFPNLKYIIAGKGPEELNLKKVVENYKLEKNIIFVGEVNESQKKYLFEKTNLMVMPTINEINNRSIEGFGIAYIEAAFFKIPSIASNIGGTNEAVLHNQTGLIINKIEELENVLRDLLTDDEKRIKLGTEAQKRALKKFKWQCITNQYISLVASLHNRY